MEEMSITEDELSRIGDGESLWKTIGGERVVFEQMSSQPAEGYRRCAFTNMTARRLRNGETVTWDGDNETKIDLELDKSSDSLQVNERRLIENCSHLSDHSTRMVAEAAKLVDYDEDLRTVPLNNIHNEIERTRQLLDEIEEQIGRKD